MTMAGSISLRKKNR